MFILFGSFLAVSGAAEVFLEFALSFTGRYTGGPAKVAVVGSGLMGMLSGSPVANVVTTGTVTIPMMKQMGFKPYFAGAVESAASCGGMFMPPIMGATAFLIAEFTGISYFEVAIAAFIPGVLYYLALFCVIHLRSAKQGFTGLPRDQLPQFLATLKKSFHLFFPVIVLMVLLAFQYTAMYAVVYAILVFLAVGMLRKSTRMDLRKLVKGLDMATRSVVPISTACATAGLVIGIITLTGLGMKLSSMITDLAGGSLFLGLIFMMITSLILGMGLPPVASYIILAALGAPVLSKLGAPLLSIHIFIFYFGTLSTITPPVCVAAYAGAGVANANPMKTGLTASRLAFVAFVAPYHMVYYPQLIMKGTPLGIASITASILFGIIAFAAVTEGYFNGRINVWIRIVLLFATVMFFWPSIVHFGVGFVILGSVYAYQKIRSGKNGNAPISMVLTDLLDKYLHRGGN